MSFKWQQGAEKRNIQRQSVTLLRWKLLASNVSFLCSWRPVTDAETFYAPGKIHVKLQPDSGENHYLWKAHKAIKLQ